MSDLTVKKGITVIRNGVRAAAADDVSVEAPLTIRLNGREAAVLLCTPEKMESLVLGCLYSRGHIASLDDVADMCLLKDGVTMEVELKYGGGPEEGFKGRAGGPECGGSPFFSGAPGVPPLQPVRNDTLTVAAGEIHLLMEELQARASLFRNTGGAHSAALAGEGRILLFCEDIGRHNAVDKIIGESLRRGAPVGDKALLCSCRLSLGILQKAARLGLPLLISRAAPTSLSIERADALNITLVGFVRENRMNIYTHPYRVRDV